MSCCRDGSPAGGEDAADDSWCHGAAPGGDDKVARANEISGASLRLDRDDAPQ
jgi:hypothetical protein